MTFRYGKSAAQIMIRWSVQNGFITIPKSSKPERIKENADVFDWSLSEEDMKLLVRVLYSHNLRNPGRDISFPIFIRKEIETRKLERKSKQKISRLIDLLYRLNDIISR